MSNFDLRKQALAREEDRVTRITAATESLPKRKTGEVLVLCNMIAQAHKTLCHYDLTENPPAIASVTETWFDAALERLAEITAQPSSEG